MPDGSDPSPDGVLHQRRRQACERCFARKQKCDRLLPACTACSSLKIECKARKWAFLDASTSDALVVNASISEYVKNLEQQLSQSPISESSCSSPDKRRRLDSLGRPSPVSADVESSPLDRDHPNGRGRAGISQSRTEVIARDTMGDISFLSRSAMAESRVRNDAFPRNLGLDSMLAAATSLRGGDPSISRADNSAIYKQRQLAHDHPALVDRDASYQYLDIFLQRVAVKHMHLADEEVKMDYDTVMSSELLCKAEIPRHLALPYFNTCLYIALGMLNSDDAADLSSLVIGLHTMAIRQITTILDVDGPLAMIRCMLTLAVLSLTCNTGGSTWHIVGLIMNQCISLGLHKELEVDDGISCQDQQERRNIFWSSYVLDRCLATAFGRPFSIPDEDITIKVSADSTPVSSAAAESDRPNTAAPFKLYLVQYARLISGMRSHGFKTALYHYRNLSFWREAPASVASFMTTSRASLTAHIDALTCSALILLIRPDSHVLEEAQSLTAVHQSPPRSSIASAHTERAYDDLENDTMLCCKSLIDRGYNHFEDSGKLADSSFLYAYELFSACVAYSFLSRRRAQSALAAAGSRSIDLIVPSSTTSPLSAPFLTSGPGDGDDVGVITQKCYALITILSLQYSSLRPLQRALMTMSARTSGSKIVMPTKELAHILPRHIMLLAQSCL
ncbi:proline utilization trans-activator [Microdochium nivale]|nr:proline utilization trans-activator [Microdochium nivale]